jgi:plastocyanin
VPTTSTGEIVAVPTASPTVPAAQVGTLVTVEETEYAIAVSTSTFSPGIYTFEIVNKGKGAHNLHITGPGIEDAASDNMASGHSTTLTVTLQAGEYSLFCASGDHRTEGMLTLIAVQ